MQAAPTPFTKLSPWSVRLAALWVLGVSCIKMLQGSPNDIPEFLRESFVGPDLSFFGSITIELACGLIALVYPRWGWWLMTALMTVFLAVLVHLISIGATSCGCFGGAVKLAPAQMLAIDGSLFAVMLLSRPWKAIAPRAVPWIPVALAGLVGAAAPWLLIENEPVALPPQINVVEDPSASGRAAGAPPVDSAPRPAPAQSSPPANADAAPKPPVAARPNSADGNLAPQVDATGQWRLPSKLPRWARLRPPEWVGKSIHQTDLAIWMDTRAYPEDATWILYLETCDHCAKYLAELEANFASDPKVYVFVRLATENDELEGIVKLKPPGETAVLPAQMQWVVGPELPPWELVLEGGLVRSATKRGE